MGRVIIAAVAVGLLTAGCSGGQQATAPPPSPQAPNATTAASSKPVLVKLGESFSIDDPSGVPAGTVMFTSAEVDPSSCPAPSDYDKQYRTPMPAGHHLATVSAVIETTAAVSATNLPPLHDGDFAEVGADGFTNTNLSPANYGFANKCVPEREKVTAGVLSPNSKYKDREVLEVSSSNGTLIYQPRFTADHPQPHSITFPQAPVPRADELGCAHHGAAHNDGGREGSANGDPRRALVNDTSYIEACTRDTELSSRNGVQSHGGRAMPNASAGRANRARREVVWTR